MPNSQQDNLQRLYDRKVSECQDYKSMVSDLQIKLHNANAALDSARAEGRRIEDCASAPAGHCLETSASPGNLQEVIALNKLTYFKAQEQAIQSVFAEVSDAIESRPVYEETDSVKRARSVLEQRDSYLALAGSEAYELLPEKAQSAAMSAWQNAERVVGRYELKIESLDQLQLPVRIVSDSLASYIVMPYNPMSRRPLPDALNNCLIELAEKLSFEHKTGAIFSNLCGYAALRLESVPDSIEKIIGESLGSIAAIAKLDILPFRTDAFGLEASDQGFKGYLDCRLRQLGYTSRKSFAEEKNLPYASLCQIIRESSIHRNRLARLADALQTGQSELAAHLRVIDEKKPTEPTAHDRRISLIKDSFDRLGYSGKQDFCRKTGYSFWQLRTIWRGGEPAEAALAKLSELTGLDIKELRSNN